MSSSAATKASFKTHLRHRRLKAVLADPGDRPKGDRDRPICVRLDPLPGSVPEDLPPVRVFVGTEPAQYRAERVFVYSISRVRNPARAYEIYLMSDLAGFDRSTWKTGFTQYRYAVPSLAGFNGRAIYNDVDQIYVEDPALLFDSDMAGSAVLSINDRETSVMLLDCEKLEPLWPEAETRLPNKHKVFRKKVHDAGLWGTMDPGWNTRDDEHQLGRTKVLHFTTLHKQPWHPFPELLRYQPHPFADVWHDLEDEADREHFTVFTADCPSEHYRERNERERTEAAASRSIDEASVGTRPEREEALERLIAKHGPSTLLAIGPGAGSVGVPELEGDARMGSIETSRVPTIPVASDRQYDGVAAFETLELMPAEDVPWLLHELFKLARQFVFVSVSCDPTREDPSRITNRTVDWWRGQIETASRGHPQTAWALRTSEPNSSSLATRLAPANRRSQLRIFTGPS